MPLGISTSIILNGLHDDTSTSPVYEYGNNDVGFCCRREAVGRWDSFYSEHVKPTRSGVKLSSCNIPRVHCYITVLLHPNDALTGPVGHMHLPVPS